MMQIMLQKILHKKWMVISLLIGNILLIAVAASHPMYQDASLQRMLSDEFGTYIEDNNKNAAMVQLTGRVRKNCGTGDYMRMKGIAEEFCRALDVKEQMRVVHNSLIVSAARWEMERDNKIMENKLKIGALNDMD